MFRLSGLLFIALAALCGAMLFWTSQSVQRAEQKLSEVSHYTLNENESLRVLSAEWDYLNRPERLEEIAKNNFDMDAASVKENNIVSNVQFIPEPMVPVIPKEKPKNLMQYVSATKKKRIEKEKILPVIKSSEKQRFNQLLDDLSEGAPE